jgi:glycerophosphoryl diester phosphodiesterase
VSAPLVIGHRGASAYRPENTLAAYDLAVEQGADMLEIDLHLTRDGEIVISHDADLEHLGRAGELADLTAAEVAELDAGEGHRVPTLAEVLDGFGERIPINLEIKRPAHGLYRGIEAAALHSVESRGLLERMLFSSFFDPVLVELRRLSSEARLAVLMSPQFPVDPLPRAAQVGALAINPHFVQMTAELRERATAEGLSIYCYTVDSEEEMHRLLDLGADGLFTNRPDVMRAVVRQREM